MRFLFCLGLLLSLVGCEDPIDDGRETASVEDTPAATRGLSREALIALTDRRADPEEFVEALLADEAPTRRLAALSLSRLHDARAVPHLRRALRDPDPEVRRNAALGLGALEGDAPPEAERALVAALAAEEVSDNRAVYLEDLGRFAGQGALGAFREALSSDDGSTREGACRGLGSYGLRRRPLELALLRRVSTRARDDQEPGVRRACAYALTRLLPPSEPGARDAVRDELVGALDDPEADVRAFVARALKRYPGAESALIARVLDADWQVSVQALRALGRDPAADRGGRLADVTRRLLDASLEDRSVDELEAHRLMTAFETLRPAAGHAGVYGVSREAHTRLGEPAAGHPLSRARGLAHCYAAELVDRGRGWPNAVLTCGLEQVEDEERRVLAVGVLEGESGAVAERAVFLRRLFGEGGSRTKQAVVAAIPKVPEASLFPLVLEALGDEDVGVVIAGCGAVAALATTWAEVLEDRTPVLSVRPAGVPAPAPNASARRRGPPVARVRRGLLAAHERLLGADDLEGLMAWLGAVEATGDASFGDELLVLAAHENVSVRRAARALRRAAEVQNDADSEESWEAVANPIAQESVLGPAPIRVLIETEAGRIVAELDAAAAPTTVARFVGLAADGFYDGLTFHRVHAAFVAQGGDPRGDGYGGPGWAQRCEDNRLRYERGTLGMALAGRDTGGSQFFITHSPQPHLDGRYTAFGRVVSGQEVVDRLLPRARILRVVVQQ